MSKPVFRVDIPEDALTALNEHLRDKDAQIATLTRERDDARAVLKAVTTEFASVLAIVSGEVGGSVSVWPPQKVDDDPENPDNRGWMADYRNSQDGPFDTANALALHIGIDARTIERIRVSLEAAYNAARGGKDE